MNMATQGTNVKVPASGVANLVTRTENVTRNLKEEGPGIGVKTEEESAPNPREDPKKEAPTLHQRKVKRNLP